MRLKHSSARKRDPYTKKSKKPHYVGFLVGIVVLLSLFGIVMLYNVSSISAFADFNDKYHYVKEQARWLLVGFGAMGFFSFFNYRRLHALALPGLVASLVLVVAVFIRGIGVRALGASRWIDIGFITLQPAELVKLSLIIYLSAWLHRPEKNRLISFLVLIALVAGPVVLQPDLGSAVVITMIALVMYFISGAPLWQFLSMIPIVISSIVLLAVTTPYRFARLTAFINPDSDPQGASYHVRQILIALGTGGMFGVGIGKSRQKFAYLPEVQTDSIFAVIAEEMGFLGATVLLFLFLALLYQGIIIVNRTSDGFGKLLAVGLTSALAIQILINLAAMVSLVPLTGIPLPFISYGGSNLVISCIMVGILVNIARNNKSV